MEHMKAFCTAWRFWLGYCAFAIVMGTLVGRIEDGHGKDWTWMDGIWWGFVTSTTTGYGDFYPVTTLGRVLAIVTMIGGIFLLATVVANAVHTANEWTHKEQTDLFDKLAELKAEIDHIHTDVHPGDKRVRLVPDAE